MKCSIFVPGHITGFFQIIDHPNPLYKGSRGAGVVLNKGILTKLKIEDGAEDVQVKINGKSNPKNASITYKTIDLIKNRFKLEDKKINITHEFQVPISTGFGTSAACALGTSLAITKTLNLPLTFNKAASIAHLAEIEMKSGLGDVMAEITGGIVLRLKEGSPGIGMADKIIEKNSDDEVYIISKTLGEIETSKIIEDPYYKKRINQTGRKLLDEIIKTPDLKTFIKLSRKFAIETSLMNSELQDLVEILAEETMGASMAMLGNTVFAISKTPDTSVEDVLISKIDNLGCKFI
ncbi:MAG: pantoate kinase [Methanobacterium sp.]